MTEKLDLKLSRRRQLAPFVERALSIAITEADNVETQHIKRLITGALWISVVMPLPVVIQLAMADAPLAALAIAASGLGSVVVLVGVWLRPSSYPRIFHLVVGVNLGISIAMTLMFGGFLESGINFIWAVVLLVGAVAVFGDRRATAWLVVTVVAFIVTSLAVLQIGPLYEHPNPALGAAITFVLVLGFVYFVLWYYVRQRAELLQLSDGLLKNILPPVIAERLKNSGESIADEYDSASILFADVADFTPMSSAMTPQELVGLLDDVFSDFDAMVEVRGLEKIKTIGDAYMVASGIPIPRNDHAEALCDLALEMREHVRTRTYGGRSVEFRIGINSGPVVAGIIGTKKFSYDLWGDSVNTASRMESAGRPGRIQITQATKELVEDTFACEAGGVVDVKGKGPMPIWFVEGHAG